MIIVSILVVPQSTLSNTSSSIASGVSIGGSCCDLQFPVRDFVGEAEGERLCFDDLESPSDSAAIVAADTRGVLG
jgi:hypothetical protein